MDRDKHRILHSLIIPIVFLVIVWVIKFIEELKGVDFYRFGIRPKTTEGLIGIFTSPLIHKDFGHLCANSLPLFFLTWGVFYFYKKIAWQSFFLIYIITGFWVWIFAREVYHIGASGLVYGLASFLFVSGVLRKNLSLASISMLVIFLYGGMIWGIMPLREKVSWESHLMGLIAGVLVAFFLKKEGPQSKKYSWELEEDIELDYKEFEEEDIQ